MSRSTIGIGIAGPGFLAETRARCYAKASGVDARLVAVAGRTREKAEDYARRHGVPTVCGDFEELLARPEVDVVDLCVPNLLHRPFTEAAARAGKHVVCTKPLSAYVGQDLDEGASDADVSARDRRTMLEVAERDCAAMVDAARAGGVQLMYGETWVYAPSVRRAIGLLEAAGDPVLEMRGWECHNGSHSPYSKLWRYTGGGALLRLGAHPIGAMLYLKRLEGLRRGGGPIRPVAVSAEVSDLTRVDGVDLERAQVATGWVDVETWGCLILTFEDGSKGIAYGSDIMVGGMESKLELFGPRSHIKCTFSPNEMVRAYGTDGEVFGGEYVMEKSSTNAGWSTPMADEDWSSGHLAMCEDFAKAVAEGRPALADGELGLEATRVTYAGYVSAAEGRRVELNG